MPDSPQQTELIEFNSTHPIHPAADHWTIAIVTKGSGSYYVNAVISEFQKRDCFLLYGPDTLTMIPAPGTSCHLAVLSFGALDLSFPAASELETALLDQMFHSEEHFHFLSLPPEPFDILSAYLKLCFCAQQDMLHSSFYIYRHTLTALLLYLVRTYTILMPEKRQEVREASSRQILLERVKYFVHQKYSEPLSLSVIADYVFTNPSYLSRIFKADTGISLSAYINQVRVENARQMLSETDELIIDVAVASGFNYIPHFNRVFKSVTGMSPTAYRKTNSRRH